MKNATYDWIWGQIEKSIVDIEAQFDSMEKDSFNFSRTYGDKTKYIVRDQYKIVRNDLKLKCYADQTTDNKIDQHKIASCFCKALIQKKVFSFIVNDNISQNMLLSNYKLAYIVSLRIIYIYLIEYYYRSGQSNLAERLMDQKTLIVPETTETHDGYNTGRIKTLAINDYYGIEFDLLTYADMMYWIEHYNRQLIEGKIQIKSDNPLEA